MKLEDSAKVTGILISFWLGPVPYYPEFIPNADYVPPAQSLLNPLQFGLPPPLIVIDNNNKYVLLSAVCVLQIITHTSSVVVRVK